MTEIMSPRYIAAGSVRGCCPHRHSTTTGALRCVRRDEAGARRQGAGCYSDRDVHREDCRAVQKVFTVPCTCGDELREEIARLEAAERERGQP